MSLNTQPEHRHTRRLWVAKPGSALVLTVWILIGLLGLAMGGGLYSARRDASAMQTLALTINDITVYEPASGTATATFTVSLSAASPQYVTVDWVTQGKPINGWTAEPGPGKDYFSSSGTLVFNPNEISKPINVTIQSDGRPAGELSTQVFRVWLWNAVNASIADDTGTCTIITR